MTESQLQILICEYLSANGVFYFSIPNERWGLKPQQMNRLKKMGLTPGMPDLCILHGKNVYFMELKIGTRPLTTAQNILIHRIGLLGYYVALCRTFEDAVKQFREWGIVK